MTRRQIARRRTAAAYDVLRGRPVKLDYGAFVLVPLLAAVGGALLAWSLEKLITRDRSGEPAVVADAPEALRPETVSA